MKNLIKLLLDENEILTLIKHQETMSQTRKKLKKPGALKHCNKVTEKQIFGIFKKNNNRIRHRPSNLTKPATRY